MADGAHRIVPASDDVFADGRRVAGPSGVIRHLTVLTGQSTNNDVLQTGCYFTTAIVLHALLPMTYLRHFNCLFVCGAVCAAAPVRAEGEGRKKSIRV